MESSGKIWTLSFGCSKTTRVQLHTRPPASLVVLFSLVFRVLICLLTALIVDSVLFCFALTCISFLELL